MQNEIKYIEADAMYQKCIKRFIDLILSLIGLIILAIPMLIVSLIIFIDDPGPIIFKQKRIGIRRTIFNCYKFRSMKMSTPHDVPTHMLENPDQYITRWGRFMRKMSIDGKVIIRQTLKNLDFARVSPILSNW